MKPLLLAAAVLSLSIATLHAVDFAAQGTTLTVAAGDADVAGHKVAVKQAATLNIAPAPVQSVTDEALKLSTDKPAGWAKGTRLRGCNARDVNAAGSFVPGSLEIRATKGGDLLKEGDDYLVDSEWGHVGLGPKSRVTANDTVYASYRVSLRRLDTVQVDPSGKVSLKQGEPHISVPVPPEADPGCTAIAHVFVDHGVKTITNDDVYPILESPAQAVTASTPGRIPKTLAKLKAGQPVTIVCLGDSVTAGGNASKPETRYVDVFAAGLRERFPQAKIDVQNISAGGSNSRQWLDPEKHPYRNLHGAENPARFDRVVAAKPDLVTIEFVNDAGLNPAGVEESYSEILKRLEPTGAEVILITPHFTMWRMMGFKSMRETEHRPYVLGLREFASKHQVGLADASARWEHLAKEGIPYLTLLHNTINHPDDRGHRLFAEELWKCFQ
ncbi:lipolytic protein G-D-S-L family [Chthoniobacter flavus Ellin428]|uniref:Lipolytic protein G-D-S-L family n=1 Tax=Chthoniobacter flavus Ellin428 TaxID=497964 RepID=B4D487_9BACT|nr:SGNH/GDSL hydrolase family protein [Chthoniobacter flavus]EDY18688.1 lipolytic protein G-D-S-L family [Chthoniobacter flavus Ellin428]TCO89073.1 lysophospholipase L1-like esterase [Chthoniobacter flavus]